jgi:hypothetical protein
MSISYKELVQGKQYIIDRPDIKICWKGIFRGKYQRYFEEYPNLIFVECVGKLNNSDIPDYAMMNIGPYKNRVDFHKTDIFYDVEKVKENRKKAIQNMEKRSLDMVLKRLVNEQFEW